MLNSNKISSYIGQTSKIGDVIGQTMVMVLQNEEAL
jgi:hypothetical protein